MIVSVYTRLGVTVRVEYLPLQELRPELRVYYDAWVQGGGIDIGEDFLADLYLMPGSWVAKMKPNPADCIINQIAADPAPRRAWGEDFVSRTLMMDLVLCSELQEPIYQHILVVHQTGYFQLLLPAKGRVYGVRQVTAPAQGRTDLERASRR